MNVKNVKVTLEIPESMLSVVDAVFASQSGRLPDREAWMVEAIANELARDPNPISDPSDPEEFEVEEPLFPDPEMYGYTRW